MFDIFQRKVKKEEIQTNALSKIEQKRKENILLEKSFKIFSNGNNEKDFMDQIQFSHLYLENFPENMVNLKKENHQLKSKNEKNFQNLQKEVEKLDKTSKILENELSEKIKEKEFLTKNNEKSIKSIENQLKKAEDTNDSLKEISDLNKHKIQNLYLKLKDQDEEIIQINEEIKKKKSEIVEKKVKECVVCLTNEANFACSPCGHNSFCEHCINMIYKCALCKSFIMDKIRIYE